MITKKNTRLAPLTTFGIGGVAERFFSTDSPEELIGLIEESKRNGKPFRLFAGGSNVIFPDGKLEGITVRVFGGRSTVVGDRITADAGVSLAEVVKKSVNKGLIGLETLSGIPGTIGGAVVGNAGAYGHSIGETVEMVEIWDGKVRRWLGGTACLFRYRESLFKRRPYVVLRVVLKLKRGSRTKLAAISRGIIETRLRKYRPGLRCPGSFFKNVLVGEISKKSLGLVDRSKIIDGKIPAGYLLEAVGACGLSCGGISVAGFHGNLVMNDGRGTAKEVRKMASILKGRVRRRFGIELREEVRYF